MGSSPTASQTEGVRQSAPLTKLFYLLEWSRAIVFGIPDTPFGAYTIGQRLARVDEGHGPERAEATRSLFRAVLVNSDGDEERARKNAALLRKLAVRNRK